MSDSRLERAWRGAGDLVVDDRAPPDVLTDLYRRAIGATRGLAFAEALVWLVVGFSLDDLGLLRFPGYAVGALGAVLILAAGRLWHARTLARRITVHAPEDVDRALDAARLRSLSAALLAAIGFLAWLTFFSAGVAPWTL